jgi:glycerol-3-phosphate dehydrogenase
MEEILMYDVVVIGAGIVGCSVARELTKFKLKICVLEKGSDVAAGTSKANSAIVHAGFDAKPDKLKGQLNAKGNLLFDKLSEELDFPFKRNGSFVLCFDKEDLCKLEELRMQGIENGVPDLQVIDGDKVRELEPNISKDVVGALYAPTGGIVCPYEMTIAMAENAINNGVEFKLQSEVIDIKKLEDKYRIITRNEEIETKLIINAAGLFADKINNMVSNSKFEILPRKGEYCLFDKSAGTMIKRTVFQLPTKLGKGILVTPTVDGNLLVGPNAVDLIDKEDLNTTKEGLDEVLEKAKKSVNTLPMNQIITSFSGLRARTETDDFIIGEVEDAAGFINVASIESPGLSSAPSIALLVQNIVTDILNPEENKDFNPKRKGIIKFREISNEERNKLIAERPEYGRVVCRCETITEGEILDAINRPLGAKDLDGVKRRTRAGMGRCQAGFCSTRILDILSRELQLEKIKVTKFGGNSNILVSRIKEDA